MACFGLVWAVGDGLAVLQIPGAVGYGGARLAIPDSAPAPLPDLMTRCFAPAGQRPTASAIRQALEDAFPRTATANTSRSRMPREFECPLSLDVMRDPVTAEDGRSYGKPGQTLPPTIGGGRGSWSVLTLAAPGGGL
jgi:hypothetical protein